MQTDDDDTPRCCICGAAIPAGRRTCGGSCRAELTRRESAARARRLSDAKPLYACEMCGAPFRRTTRQRYCSPPCKAKATAAWREAERIRDGVSPKPGEYRDAHGYLHRPCAVCGKDTIADNGRIYCSDACKAGVAKSNRHLRQALVDCLAILESVDRPDWQGVIRAARSALNGGGGDTR